MQIPVHLDGRLGILEHVEATLKRKGHAVIVVSMGAGQRLLRGALSLCAASAF